MIIKLNVFYPKVAEVGLTQTVYDVVEDVGMVEVCVEILHGSIAPSFHVNLTTTNGTASKDCMYKQLLKPL